MAFVPPSFASNTGHSFGDLSIRADACRPTDHRHGLGRSSTARIRPGPVLGLALLLLAHCGPQETKTVCAAPPEVLALFAGQARGSDFSLARACGANPGRLKSMAGNEQPPVSLSPDASAIYRAGLLSRADATTENPPVTFCDQVQKRAEFASLFPRRPQTKAELAAAAERKARA